MPSDIDDQKRALDIKLRMHAASMGGNLRLPKKSKNGAVQTDPWKATNASKEIEKLIGKKEPETQYELTEKALSMADAIMSTKGTQNMMTNPIMSSSRKNPARNTPTSTPQQNQQNIGSGSKKPDVVKKDPNFATVSAGSVRPLKVNDSMSDVLGKMYNFMEKQYLKDSKRFKETKKYNTKLINRKEHRIEELIKLFGGKYTKKLVKVEEKDSFFANLLKYVIVGGILIAASKSALAMVGEKLKSALPEIPDYLSFLKIDKVTTEISGGTANSLGELIARGESGGNYDIYNTGKAGVSGPPLKLSEMTVGEVMDLQKQGKVFAAGKYQMTPDTLAAGVQSLKISRSEKFSPDIQDKMFNEYLIGSKRPEIQKYLNDPNPDKKTEYDFLKALSKEFAAVEDPDKPGKSYYEGKAGNKASIGTSEILSAAQNDKKLRQTELAKKENLIPKSSVTVEQSPPIPLSIPDKLPSVNKSGAQEVSILNNNTNIVNGASTYLVSEEKVSSHSALYDKQYNYS